MWFYLFQLHFFNFFCSNSILLLPSHFALLQSHFFAQTTSFFVPRMYQYSIQAKKKDGSVLSFPHHDIVILGDEPMLDSNPNQSWLQLFHIIMFCILDVHQFLILNKIELDSHFFSHDDVLIFCDNPVLDSSQNQS